MELYFPGQGDVPRMIEAVLRQELDKSAITDPDFVESLPPIVRGWFMRTIGFDDLMNSEWIHTVFNPEVSSKDQGDWTIIIRDPDDTSLLNDGRVIKEHYRPTGETLFEMNKRESLERKDASKGIFHSDDD